MGLLAAHSGSRRAWADQEAPLSGEQGKVGAKLESTELPQRPKNLAMGLKIRVLPQFWKLETSQLKDIPRMLPGLKESPDSSVKTPRVSGDRQELRQLQIAGIQPLTPVAQHKTGPPSSAENSYSAQSLLFFYTKCLAYDLKKDEMHEEQTTEADPEMTQMVELPETLK